MNFKAHATTGVMVAGVTSLVTFVVTRENNTSLLCALIVFLMSLFPDLDTASKPSQYYAGFCLAVSCVLMYYQEYYYVSLIGMSFLCVKVGKHRGWTHKYSLIFVFIVLAIIFPNYDLIFLSCGVGLLTHYACDTLNPLLMKNWI